MVVLTMPPDRLEQLRAVAGKELRTPNDMPRVIAIRHFDSITQDEGEGADRGR